MLLTVALPGAGKSMGKSLGNHTGNIGMDIHGISMENPLLADHWDDSLWFLATLLATLHSEKTHHFFNS